MPTEEKKLAFWGSSLDDIKAFPEPARRRAGFELHLVQHGDMPSDWKPMSSVGSGVKEIRIHERNEYRVLYIARFDEAVYVIHAFEKKSFSTPRRDIKRARRRLKEIKQYRRDEGLA